MNYGIDLGTTNSCVAGWDENMDRPKFYYNEVEGSTVTPSVVFFDPNDSKKVLVGRRALASFLRRPDRIVRGIKRRIGDPDSYDPNISGLPNGTNPVSISSMILKKLVQDVKRGHQQDVRNVVITVPAYFGLEQRSKTKLAGEYAGLNVLELIPEPTAAALAYGLDSQDDKNVIVYDLGGGTFDVTFVRILANEDGTNTFKYIALDGNDRLGGMDWDRELAQLLLNKYNDYANTTYSLRKEEELTDDSKEAKLTATLLEKAKEIKELLGSDIGYLDSSISFDGIVLEVRVTLDEFNQLTRHLLDKTIETTRSVIETARKAGYQNPDEIILVGGSTRMVQVTEALKETFGIEPQLHNPDFAVATGAAIYANKIGQYINDNENILHIEHSINNILSKTYGIQLIDGSIGNFLFRNERLPIDKIVNRFFIAADDASGLFLSLYESDLLETPENLSIPASEVNAKSKCVAECETQFIKRYPANTPVSMHIKANNEQLIDIEVNILGEKQSVRFELGIQETPGQREYISSVKVS